MWKQFLRLTKRIHGSRINPDRPLHVRLHTDRFFYFLNKKNTKSKNNFEPCSSFNYQSGADAFVSHSRARMALFFKLSWTAHVLQVQEFSFTNSFFRHSHLHLQLYLGLKRSQNEKTDFSSILRKSELFKTSIKLFFHCFYILHCQLLFLFF